MCDFRWNPLAEFYLYNEEYPEEIYCLCSRVFTWSNETNEDFSPVEEEVLKKQLTITADDTEYFLQTTKQCGETEPVSCYCSASHTDNISTDEHDSWRDSHASSQFLTVPKPLQLSDSGADLSESIGCNNVAWQKYWALNGERLIWESWIAKYSAYINPEYLQSSQEQRLYETYSKNPSFEEQDKAEGNSLKLSFDSLSPHQDSSDYSATLGLNISINSNQTKDNPPQKQPPSEVVEKNRMLIRNLSGSESYDKLYREGEGWNPLSPVSNDCETEAERLLSSRCASHTGSSARTIDSMTNVTRMTVSSIDLSEASKNSDSFSSVSSVQSSVTSSSEEVEAIDYDQQWSALWTKHYEEEYLENYKIFASDRIGKSAESTDDVVESKSSCDIEDNSGDGSTPKTSLDLDEETSKSSDKIVPGLTSTNSEQTLVNANKIIVASRKKRVKAKRINSEDTNFLSAVLHSMKMEENKTSDSCKSDVEIDTHTCSSDQQQNESNLPNVETCWEEINQMALMGLPTRFKSNNPSYISPKKQKLEQKSSDDMDQSSSNRIKAAFNLIGMELHEGAEAKYKGCVNYKMKQIRLQNRRLQFHKRGNFVGQPKHIHFDDDGFAIPEDSEANKVTVQNSHQAELLGIVSSSSTEDETELVPEEVQSPEEEKSKGNKNRRKKRKRKVNLPSEIKDNPSLRKYWRRRYSLFSKFDEGIKLDEESWFSVTPELIARNTAQRCSCNVIVDAFCGAGGNSIQFALTCNRVIAIDIDPKKIELAKHNAEVYGVADRIDFLVGDFFQLSDNLKADIVFLSPPWGGVKYLSGSTYDLELLQPEPFMKLLNASRKITDNIGLFLPKNSNTHQLLTAAGHGGKVELEQNFLNKRLIALSAYYGNLIREVPLEGLE